MADLTPRMREVLGAAVDGKLHRWELSADRPTYGNGGRVNEGTMSALLRRRAIRLGDCQPDHYRPWEITDEGRALLGAPCEAGGPDA